MKLEMDIIQSINKESLIGEIYSLLVIQRKVFKKIDSLVYITKSDILDMYQFYININNYINKKYNKSLCINISDILVNNNLIKDINIDDLGLGIYIFNNDKIEKYYTIFFDNKNNYISLKNTEKICTYIDIDSINISNYNKKYKKLIIKDLKNIYKNIIDKIINISIDERGKG